MDSSVFDFCIDNINELTDVQFISLKNKFKDMNYNRFLSVSLDESTDIVSCGHCKSINYNKWGRRDDMQRYRCKDCGKTFNTLTGTPLSYLHKKDKWIQYAWCLKKGLSIRKAANECGIHKNTSFRWRHRFLKNTLDIKALELFGIVEMDSFFMIKSYKGSRSVPRKSRKRGLSAKAKSTSKEKFSIFFSRNRASFIYDKIFDSFCDFKVDFSLDKLCCDDTLLFSKKESIYKHFDKNEKIQHSLIKNRKDVIKNNIVHINNVNQYCTDLKLWMRRFNGVATRYLHGYISWYRFLDEFDMNIKPEAILLRAKSGGIYKYQPLFGT